MTEETKDRVTEKIEEISKSISNTEAGTSAERNLVNNMVLLARLQQEDEKQKDIRDDNQSKGILEARKLEYEKAKNANELDFRKLCEDHRMAESDKKVETDYIKFKEELEFKRECERNRHEEAMKKIDAEAAEAQAKRDFERFKFEQDCAYRYVEADGKRKERLVDFLKVGLGAAIGFGSVMTTIYTVKAACTVDKDYDAMPSKTLQSLMIRGIQKVNI